ncbi:MAG: bifunctional DNA-formamidopyrimidine glycosylase/DNA-(apurinic or apyrimidinic site) lyase [Betaproteobacteria bacterium]
MPELPEVETTRRDIVMAVVGRRIAAVTVYDPRLRWPVPPDLPRILADKRVLALDRRSKYLLFRFAVGTMIVHFGMTGSLRVLAKAPARRPHDHIDWLLDDGVTLRYHDPRRFGAVLWTTDDPHTHPLLRELGPEPLESGFDGAHLWHAARGRGVAVKTLLMDSDVVVGVGNIYASEALYRAGIRPTTPARRVSRARMYRLAAAVRDVLQAAIDQGGSTLRDYVNGRGEAGRAQHGHFVYGREGKPCRVCAAPVRSRYVGQRNTFYCPTCQK